MSNRHLHKRDLSFPSPAPSHDVTFPNDETAAVEQEDELCQALLSLIESIVRDMQDELRQQFKAQLQESQMKRLQHEKVLSSLAESLVAKLLATKEQMVEDLEERVAMLKASMATPELTGALWPDRAPQPIGEVEDHSPAYLQQVTAKNGELKNLAEQLKHGAGDFGRAASVFCSVIFFDPRQGKLDAAVHLPVGQALPGANELMRAMEEANNATSVQERVAPEVVNSPRSTAFQSSRADRLFGSARGQEEDVDSRMIEQQFTDDTAQAMRSSSRLRSEGIWPRRQKTSQFPALPARGQPARSEPSPWSKQTGNLSQLAEAALHLSS
ncbi:hypothetical protein TruAng_011929 [Truncatella angustata]|nr:hypothetical protein TruAng_011929 [Truncatella angustata]